jgi:hypothetical protein
MAALRRAQDDRVLPYGSRCLDRTQASDISLRVTIAAKMPGHAALGRGEEHVGSLA